MRFISHLSGLLRRLNAEGLRLSLFAGGTPEEVARAVRFEC